MPRCRTGDLEVYYEFDGAGPPVLFISGTGGDLRVRPNVFSSPLAERARVLAYDQRGLGQTTIPDAPATMADYADDAAALLAELDFVPAAVIGVSFGGMVAQHLALRHPERVPRLVLCCTSGGGTAGSSYPLHELAELPEAERAIRQLELSDRRLDARWRAEHPDRLREMVASMQASRAVGAEEPGRAHGARLQLEARRSHDVAERLGELTMPVLIAAGRHDGIAPLDNQHALLELIPAAQLEVFDGGHLFLLQDRRAWPTVTEWALA